MGFVILWKWGNFASFLRNTVVSLPGIKWVGTPGVGVQMKPILKHDEWRGDFCNIELPSVVNLVTFFEFVLLKI